MTTNGITMVVCSIPQRTEMLHRALRTVTDQTLLPENIIVSYDFEGLGHAGNRNKAVEMVTTEWTAFVDDDDYLLPHHLQTLYDTALTTGADLVYPWHIILDRDGNQIPDILHHPDVFEEDRLRRNNYIPVTLLVKTAALRAVGGFPTPGPGEMWRNCEDFGCWVRLLDAGYKFVHANEVTWIWNHWGGNTSGHV